MSHPRVGTPEIVEIRNGLRVGNVVVIALKLGFGFVFGALAIYKSWLGAAPGQLAFLWLATVALLTIGAFHLQTALDGTIQLTLSPDGLRDRRSGGVLIPWAAIKKVSNHPGYGSASSSINLELDDSLAIGSDLISGSGTTIFNKKLVRINIDALDTDARELIGHIKHFCPHVAIARPFAPRV